MTESIYIAPDIRTQTIDQAYDFISKKRVSRMVLAMKAQETIKQKAAKIHTNGKKEPSIIIASTSESRSSGFPQMTKSGNTVFFAWTDDSAKKVQMASMDLSY